jgi:hypothetical protein
MSHHPSGGRGGGAGAHGHLSHQQHGGGGEPLRFSLVPSCACSELDPREGEILPGEVAAIKVGVQLRAEGRDENVAVRFTCNDPKRPEATLWVVAACPAKVLVEPRHLDFGVVGRGATPVKEVHLTVHKPADLPRPPQLQVNCDSPSLQAEVIRTAPATWSVKVGLRSDVAVGTFASQLHISGAGWDREVEIPVTADVRGAVLTAPAVVRLRRTADGPTKLLVWRADGADLGELWDRQLPPGVTIMEAPASGAKRRLFLLAFDSAVPWQGERSKDMTLVFQGVEETVRVPLKVE